MNTNNKIFCIFGTGGMGRETLVLCLDKMGWTLNDAKGRVLFMVDDEFFTSDECMGLPVKRLSEIDSDEHQILITLGDGSLREKIVNKLPNNTEFTSLIHPRASVSGWVDLGEGALVAPAARACAGRQPGFH